MAAQNKINEVKSFMLRPARGRGVGYVREADGRYRLSDDELKRRRVALDGLAHRNGMRASERKRWVDGVLAEMAADRWTWHGWNKRRARAA